MNAITYALFLVAIVAVPAPGWAGNSTLMARNAGELIDINREVLEGLKTGNQDGEYRLMARILEQNGERVIKVDRFERLGSPDTREDTSRPTAVRTSGEKEGGKDKDEKPKKPLVAAGFKQALGRTTGVVLTADGWILV